MKIFLDTSALFKLYHRENGTELIENIFNQNKITQVFISEISKLEFASTVWKKVRMKEIDENRSDNLIKLFESDISKYTLLPSDNKIIESSYLLIAKYGLQGLRTLDSIQFSTALSLKEEAELFLTFDMLLGIFFENESLNTKL